MSRPLPNNCHQFNQNWRWW